MTSCEFDKLTSKIVLRLIAFSALILLVTALAAIDNQVTNIFTISKYLAVVIVISFLFYLIIKKDLKKYHDYSSREIEAGRIYKDAIINNTNSIIVVDEEFRVDYFNDAAKKAFFLTFAKFNKLPVTELVYKQDRDRLITQIKNSTGAREIYKINCGHLTTTREDFYAYFSIKKYIYREHNRYLLVATDCSEIYRQIATNKNQIALLEKIVDTMPWAVTVFDNDGKTVISNMDSYESAITNNNNRDTIIKAPKDFYSLANKSHIKNILYKGFDAASSGLIFSKNAVSVQSGRDKWLNLTFAPMTFLDNSYIVYTYSDITYAIERYNEISLYSKAYFGIFDNSEVSMVLIDADGNIVDINKRFIEWSGLNGINSSNYKIPLEELIRKINFTSIVINPNIPASKLSFSGENISNGIEKFLTKIETAEIFEVDLQFVVRDQQSPDASDNIQDYGFKKPESGKLHTVYNKNFPIFDANGKLKFVLLEFIDRTKLDEINRRYNSARMYLDAIANNFSMGFVFIVNQDHEVVFIGGEEAVKKELLTSGLSTRLFFNFSQIFELEKLSEPIKRTLEGKSHKQEYKIFGINYSMNLVPILDSRGQVRFCLGVGFNIDDRYEYESQILEQKKFYETIVDSAVIPIAVINRNKRLVNANKAYLDLFGAKSATELLGNVSMDDSVFSLFPNDVKKAKKILEKAERVFSGETVDLEIIIPVGYHPLVHKEKILKAKIAPIYGINNQVTHCVLLFQDISELRALIEELKEVQNQIKEEKEFRDKIFNETINPISVYNTKREIVFANKAFLEFFEYSSFSEIADTAAMIESTGAAMYENFHEVHEQFMKVLNGEIETVTVEMILLKEGAQFTRKKFDKDMTVQAMISSIRDNNNKVTHVIYMLQDITEFRTNIIKLEDAQKQVRAEKLLRDKIFNETLLPLATVDVVALKFAEINQAFLDLFSVANSSKLKEVDLGNPDIYEKNPELFSYFLQILQGHTIEVEITVPSGYNPLLQSVVPDDKIIIIKASPVFGVDGKTTHSIIVIQDITKLRKAIEEIRESRKINEIVISNFPEGILLLIDKNLTYKLVAGNSEAAGINKNELVSTSMRDHPNLIGHSFLDFVEHTFSEAEFYHFDLFYADAGTHYNVSLQPIIDEYTDEVEYVLITMINITDRKQFEQSILDFNAKLDDEVELRTKQLQETSEALESRLAELNSTQAKLLFIQKELATSLRKEQKLNEMKSRFISLISHEYRTPMTVIRTYTYLLEHFFDKHDKEKFTNSTHKISSAIETMTQLLNNVLFLEEVEEINVYWAEVDIVETILETIQITKSANNSINRINFTRNIESLNIFSDRRLLKQIIDNILSNAIKYSPKDSVINVNFLDMEDSVKFTIEDFGMGIHEDVRNNVFDSFVRSAEVTNISGAGLGLYLAKRCVDYLQGEIKFETKPNEGTTFTVTLPKLSSEVLKSNSAVDNSN